MATQAFLPFQEDQFVIPHWCYDLGYHRSHQVLRLIKMNAGIIHRAQLDGIEHVAPILLALRCAPDEARRRVGKATWKAVHHSTLNVNVARSNVLIKSTIRLQDLIHFPRGALREVLPKLRDADTASVVSAGHIAKNRPEFREAVMLAKDTARMGGEVNPAWSMRRLREEHDRRAMEWARAKADPTPWHDPWSEEMEGYRFTILNSFADFSAEGHVMRHCVASYAKEAKARKYIIMMIEGPERATVRFGGDPVRVLEVKSRFNAPVSARLADVCRIFCAEYLTNGKADDEKKTDQMPGAANA